MALWMDAGATPTTEKEKADLEAISALKESTAIEFKVPLSSLARSILMFDVVFDFIPLLFKHRKRATNV